MVDLDALREALDDFDHPERNWEPGLLVDIANAARELLHQGETTVWWCEKHNAESKGTIGKQEHYECWRSWSMRIENVSCRMVEARLVVEPKLFT